MDLAIGNSLILRGLWFRNFLSFGNTDTFIRLDEETISVIMGENLDTGGEDSRNGVGKSAIIDALCYVLFGKTIRDISNQKLINKLSRKGQPMIVALTFDKGNFTYLVERSERPSKLLFLRKPLDCDEDIKTKEKRKFKYDISRNKNETTAEIIELLGFDITLFEFLVANSSESTPFFKLTEGKRREVVEKLFGFTILGERADKLRTMRKDEKDNLLKAETAYSTTVAANDRLTQQISEMEQRAESWELKKARAIKDLQETITSLESVNVSDEIELLKLNDTLKVSLSEAQSALREKRSTESSLKSDIARSEKDLKRYEKVVDASTASLAEVEKSTCPTCKQHWEADPEYRGKLEDEITDAATKITRITEDVPQTQTTLDELISGMDSIRGEVEAYQNDINEISGAGLTYSTVEEASEAGTTLKLLQENLTSENSESNPHEDSIKDLKTKAIVKVDKTEIKEFQKIILHYDFMISLLTDKNSYVRKKIIDRWLPKLNQRIHLYLKELELPHTVRFQPDMSVEISKYNEDFDYGNLSKGERNRLNIALNFSFQDVFELMNYRINLLAIDELIDNGICNRGAENTVNILKEMATRKHKKVFLITHREDIAARVDDMMIVQKENDISRIVAAR